MSELFKVGAGILPLHASKQSPTVLFEEDLQLIEQLDRTGIDEVWIGEHHSGGVELITSPELFLAAAAQRTKRIKLATGVASVPYHNPLTLAARMALLDHLSLGRVVLGLGPGQLVSDAHMLGIDPLTQRERMSEGAGVIQRLLRGETITEKSEWYDLRDAQLQVLPFNPDLEIVAAAAISPTGPRISGRYGFGMINFAAGTQAGFDALRTHWSIAEEEAEKHGTTISRSQWRLASPIHIAETREDAVREVARGGFAELYQYLGKISVMEPFSIGSIDDLIAKAAEGGVIIGTPDDVIERIELLQEQTGGFGGFVAEIGDFASPEATARSMELYARYVKPAVTGQLEPIKRSQEWQLNAEEGSVAGTTVWRDQMLAAIAKATSDYDQSKGRG